MDDNTRAAALVEAETRTVQHPSVVERYFTPRYKPDVKKVPGEDQCVLVHSNRICVVTVARCHPILSQHKTVCAVNFQVDKKTNRMDNKVTGKGKKGGQWLTELSALCHVTCSDQSTYTLYSCIRGHLVEINENLVRTPGLLTQKPDTDGYIAIVLPRLHEFQDQVGRLLTLEQYQHVLKQRQSQQQRLDTQGTNKQQQSETVVQKSSAAAMRPADSGSSKCATAESQQVG
ncbi:protein Simiate [Lingula anatina]|uniref:Protein Abitram n=1 Tax=Lingula anatina TaxID=7574 RepID=A0A1S3HHR9_LINAN|nr:protein Simiate [Lingula anatina]|eukprot:XP_013385567.1 protein Simiate [Lingula anatina]